ncbi:helix-turn-helix domain-containing protein [Xenorhabdus bovienii]|uniref:helix-turn-helix domain-containing protein n=1 Tax=Xenorhabdus bovienii TaxID=40576 RepID=UPI0023B27DC9|nr:helix-turn-helix domain-containing protein [Xenorhabdus bovienii]MDE9427742.1 helix-turn-helix domain-containing protein [Xenorhabdus bovienii]MDE9457935.1 helix-turn-helix domain-containing protein [Xenorhabdus bovienii]MDE9486184.1 helix-turn-helix domain-containing protein [Xenorhabdus bovienii]MDE9514001.1 helix-turn-helix domain-containing protein [Xenorhabdus bovienii]
MSMSLMVKAMSIRVGNPLRKLVLIKLADNANDKGECWPSYQHIADHCECSKSAVRSHINVLIKMGLLTKENRLGNHNGKGNASNVYYLNLSADPVSPKSIPPVPPAGSLVSFAGTPVPSGDIPPMPSDGTRTSHSFEPVNESVKEPIKPKGTEQRQAAKKSAFDPLTAKPENVSAETWADWVKFRQEIRKPLTETSCRQQAKQLAGCTNPDEVICTSIANSWQGLFPDKPRSVRQPQVNTHTGFEHKRYESHGANWTKNL